MKFLVQSAKTKQFLYESVQMPAKAKIRALWATDQLDAKVFKTAAEANQVALRLSPATRARVVLWDDFAMWNVTVIK